MQQLINLDLHKNYCIVPLNFTSIEVKFDVVVVTVIHNTCLDNYILINGYKVNPTMERDFLCISPKPDKRMVRIALRIASGVKHAPKQLCRFTTAQLVQSGPGFTTTTSAAGNHIVMLEIEFRGR